MIVLNENNRFLSKKCSRCKIRYIVNADSDNFHKLCDITSYRAVW